MIIDWCQLYLKISYLKYILTYRVVVHFNSIPLFDLIKGVRSIESLELPCS